MTGTKEKYKNLKVLNKNIKRKMKYIASIK